MTNKILPGAIIILIIVGIGAFLVSRKPNLTNTLAPTQTQSQIPVTKVPEVVMTKEVTVALTSTGFDPQIITIKPGTKVIWTNKSRADATINSDDHPTHKLYPELNLGTFADSTTHQLILTKTGTYTYHDHFHPDRKGKVVVE